MQTSKNLDITTIIATKNRMDNLKQCIESLIIQTYPINELIIVDGSENNSTADYIKTITEKRPNFNCIYVKQILGGNACARNIGIDCASGDIIFFIDDDVILDKDYVKGIMNILYENINIVGVGGSAQEKTNNRLINLLYPIFGIIFLRDSWRKGSVTIAGHHSRHPNKSSYVEWLDGKCMTYRKSVLDEFKFDERLEHLSPYALYEDLDLSYSISRKYKLFLTTNAKLTHNHSLSSRLDNFKIHSVKIQNHYYLVKKHGFSTIGFWWSTFGILLVLTIILLLKPSRANYMAIAGLVDGIVHIRQ